MFVDLDHFKRVNDTLGHDAGDELLRGVAARLAQSLREGDLIARWGGDEFTVLVPRMRCSGEVGTLARRVIEALQPPFEIGGLQLRVSASVGVASWPDDGEDGPSLLRRADMALYRAKEEGRNGYHCYRASDFAGLDDGLSLETALQRAVAEGGLQLHYQPQVDTRSGRICSVEALARWHHPERGWISPAVFIPLAERTGDILALGAWVLRTACAQAAAWRAAGLGDFSVAVNISPAQFERSDLPALVAEVLEDTGLAPEALEIEVTESVAVRRVGETAQALRTLQSRGVRIALDDFGTGYASLAAFKDLPCDTLKIDRSFIAGLERAGADRGGSKDAAIVRALQALAEGLGLRLVAEGVETAAVTTALQGLGCWTHQGYWLHRPMPAAELEKVLRGTRTTPAPLASSAGEGHLGRPAGEPARPARASLPG
jgi:diguanylate cyclase (GGDEF)-like protein